jgi:hypothetical protein
METFMTRSNRELWLSLAAMLFITFAYLLVSLFFDGVPAASGFFGHSIGILGFILMILTETLYSFRKRSRSARWGKMSSWLQFHIFTGLVGPYMVLLHTSWKFNGLAGVVLLLTVVVVFSGVIGRYIYTSIPRSADGIEIESSELQRRIAGVEAQIRHWEAKHPEAHGEVSPALSSQPTVPQKSMALQYWGRTFAELADRLRWWQHRRTWNAQLRAQTRSLERLLRQHRTLQRQVSTLTMARRALSLWHAVHIPIGLALFTSAFVHIGAAIYYASLLR